ncbi:MAG: AAA family ATPase [Geobacteraceae bacterium]|nr:AAA family ATPase [Geobacteraceae bacterium]
MYNDFYCMTERPFSKTPDPRFLYLSRGHREALARLMYVAEEREIALLTGEIGCGKTTLSRALMDNLGEEYRFCFIVNPRLSALEFLRSVARAFSPLPPADDKESILNQIADAVFMLHNEGVSPVLIVDEAQLISDMEIFDEIRLLTNFQLDDRNLITIILMGQPELRGMLSSPVFEPLRQRITMQFHLTPLEIDDVQEYLDCRLEVAGGFAGLFTPDAVQRIYDLSQGVPRRINQIATNAILEGYGRDEAIIDAAVVDSVASELLF